MVERRPVLAVVTHAVLVLGVLTVAFPLYVTLVASTHTAETLLAHVPLWFGGHFGENYRTVLGTGMRAAGGAAVSTMLGNSLVMAGAIAGGEIAISLPSPSAIRYLRLPPRVAA